MRPAHSQLRCGKSNQGCGLVGGMQFLRFLYCSPFFPSYTSFPALCFFSFCVVSFTPLGEVGKSVGQLCPPVRVLPGGREGPHLLRAGKRKELSTKAPCGGRTCQESHKLSHSVSGGSFFLSRLWMGC